MFTPSSSLSLSSSPSILTHRSTRTVRYSIIVNHLLLLPLLLLLSVNNNIRTVTAQIPSSVQSRFYKRTNTQFMHFSLCTFNGCDGLAPHLPDPNTFNPTDLDTDQWMDTAVLWGASTVCLTVRHVDGFALWPTQSSPYNIAASQMYLNGTGDIVRDFVTSARKYGIDPCFYIILGFNIYANHTNVSGSQYLLDQQTALTELLTNYGPIPRLWWDNYALDATKWQPVSHEGFSCTNDTLGPSCPAWTAVTNTARSLSPDTVLLPGPDGCLIDAESVAGQYPLYHDGNYGSYVCDFATVPYPNSSTFLGIESDFSILNPGDRWFYDNNPNVSMHAADIWSSLSLKRGQGANVIFNIPPDTTGQIPDIFVNTLAVYREVYDATYSLPLAGFSTAVTGYCSNDGNGLSIVIPVDPTVIFDQLLLREDMSINGQIVNGYTFETQDNTTENWTPLSIQHGITIGTEIIDWGLGNLTNVKNIRFNCTATIPGKEHLFATIMSINAYLGASIPSSVGV